MKRIIYILVCFFIHSSCIQKSPSTDKLDAAFNEVEEENQETEHLKTNIENQKSTPIEKRYHEGTYYVKLDRGAIKMLIHPRTDTTCRFVFDTGAGTPYFAKLAGDLKIDKNGKATFSGPSCKALDFHFTEKGISVKEYKCNFHSSAIAFDGFYTTVKPISDNPKVLIHQIENGEQDFDFYASFTEPFWTLYFIGDKVVFNHMEEDGPDLYTLEQKFDSKKEKQILRFSNGNKKWEMVIENGEGSDGMSELIYPYNVILNDDFHGGGGKEYVREKN